GHPVSSIADGAMLAGHAHGEAVLLARRGDEFFSTGACTWHECRFLARVAAGLGSLARPAIERCRRDRSLAAAAARKLNEQPVFRLRTSVTLPDGTPAPCAPSAGSCRNRPPADSPSRSS